MGAIFPPTGPQDRERYLSVEKAEREYMMFCLEFCSRVLERRPCHLDALALAAGYFTEFGYYADGLRVDQALGALKPRDPVVLYNLACSYSLNSLPDEALDALMRAVENGYADHRHVENDRDLEAVRRDPRFAVVAAAIARKAGEAGGAAS